MDKVVHFEIPADDLDRAQEFYKKMFEWQINKVPNVDIEYHMINTVAVDANNMPVEKGAINGGLVKRVSQGESPVIVIDVSSIDTYLTKTKDFGGKVLMPKIKIGEFGYYARISDTEGNILGLWEPIKTNS